MREIKFRGKHYATGKWVYGDLVRHACAPGYVFIGTKNDGTIQVIPETVGQFTGLKDKNGRDIYEGDILRGDDYPFISEGLENYRAVVAWGDDTAGFYSYPEVCSDRVRGCAAGCYVFEDGKKSAKRFEVIGNIYETPEAIKEGGGR